MNVVIIHLNYSFKSESTIGFQKFVKLTLNKDFTQLKHPKQELGLKYIPFTEADIKYTFNKDYLKNNPSVIKSSILLFENALTHIFIHADIYSIHDEV